MNKQAFIANLASEQSISKKQAGENLAAVLTCIENAVINEDGVQFIGFGNFTKVIREGKAPGTGKPYKSAGCKFKISAPLKAKLNK